MKAKNLFICTIVALMFSVAMNIVHHNERKAYEKEKQYIVTDILYCDLMIPYYEEKAKQNEKRILEYPEDSFAREAFQRETIRYRKFVSEWSNLKALKTNSLINLK